MGAVFSARHIELDSTRALKIPDAAILDDELGRKMFVREAQAVERLSHPNITRIFDVVNKPDLIYIAMELIEGTEINKYLMNNQDRLTIHDLLNLIEQIGQALDFAHQQGVIHRDIKPNNIMVSKENNLVKILDFGIARISGKTMADFTLRSAGTPRFMAPEQFKGKESVPQTDLYSLAVIIYQLFTGKPVFEADTSDAIGFMAVHEMPVPIMTHNDNLPQSLNDVIMKALAKDPSHRYPTGANFYQALKSSLAGSEDLSIKDFLNAGPSKTVLPNMIDDGTTEGYGGPTGTRLATTHSATTEHAEMPGTKPTRIESTQSKKAMPVLIAAVVLVVLGIGYYVTQMGSGGEGADQAVASNNTQQTNQVASVPNQTPVENTQQNTEPTQTTEPEQTNVEPTEVVEKVATPIAPQIDPSVKIIRELERVLPTLTAIPADKEHIQSVIKKYTRALDEESKTAAFDELKEIYEFLPAIEAKNKQVANIYQKRNEKVALATNLKNGGWLESEQGLVDESWKPAALEMLEDKPFEPNQEEFQEMAIREIEELEQRYTELSRKVDKIRSEKIAVTKTKIQNLDSDLEKLIVEAKSLAAAKEFKDEKLEAERLNAELDPIEDRYLTIDQNDYTMSDYKNDQVTIQQLSQRFQKIREALYQKPIIVIEQGLVDEFGYNFSDEQSAFDELFLNKNYVVIEKEIEHDAIYNISIEFSARKANERESILGAGNPTIDFLHSYTIKVKNGGTILDKKQNQLKWTAIASQLNDDDYKEKVAEFRKKFREDLFNVAESVNQSFAEVVKKKEAE